MTTAYIALGSNQGDRMRYLARAVEAMAHIPESHLDRVSHAYESQPAYGEGPDFANAVAELQTDLEAQQLLGYLQQIETDLGRVSGPKNGPRVIDLDIVLFGDEEIDTPELVVPHPALAERAFVVIPLLDIAPHVRMPDGSRLHRDQATEGPLVGDLGEIADIGANFGDPALAEDWVVVSTCDAGQDVVTGWDAAISLQREVLQDAGIPYAFDPYEPDMSMDPFGMPITYKILVPAAEADRARKLLDEVMAAPPEFPEGLE